MAVFVQTTLAQVHPKQPRSTPKMEKMQGKRAYHMQIPNLTDEQKEQIKSIMLNHQEAMIPLRNQVREKTVHLRTLTTGADIDEKAADSVIEEIGDLRTQMMKNRFQTHQQIRTLLTDEQRVWLD
ncbi:MAG: Spy/CpxP family protein refolding chaperone [Balneolaceae bacterium]